MGVKHSWGNERETRRLIDIIGQNSGFTGKMNPPSAQGQGRYDDCIIQKCTCCGAVRERLKKEEKPNIRINPWSSLWDSDKMNLLACPLQSSNIVYKVRIYHDDTDYILLEFNHDNNNYKLLEYDPVGPHVDDNPLFHTQITALTGDADENCKTNQAEYDRLMRGLNMFDGSCF